MTGSNLQQVELMDTNAINELYHWACANKLCLSESKTSFMLFHTYQHTVNTQCNVQINGNQTNNFKFLAIHCAITTTAWKNPINSKVYLFRSLRIEIVLGTLLSVFHSWDLILFVLWFVILGFVSNCQKSFYNSEAISESSRRSLNRQPFVNPAVSEIWSIC